MRAISQEMLKISILDMRVILTHLRLQPYHTGANELMILLNHVQYYRMWFQCDVQYIASTLRSVFAIDMIECIKFLLNNLAVLFLIFNMLLFLSDNCNRIHRCVIQSWCCGMNLLVSYVLGMNILHRKPLYKHPSKFKSCCLKCRMYFWNISIN